MLLERRAHLGDRCFDQGKRRRHAPLPRRSVRAAAGPPPPRRR
jgi:hypothetical protein